MTRSENLLYIHFRKHTPSLGYISHSDDLFLWFGVRRRATYSTVLFSRTTGQVYTKFGMHHFKGKEIRNCKFY